MIILGIRLFDASNMRLPFKIEPKKIEAVPVGDEQIGVLEIPKLTDLSPGERIYIREHTKHLPDIRGMLARTARAISVKTGMKMTDAYDALAKNDLELLGEYLEEFIDLQQIIERNSTDRRMVLATAMIRRLEGMGGWQQEDTGNANFIHPKLVEALADFAQKEENGWVEPEPVTEEDLVKPPTEETVETEPVTS